MSFYKLLSSLYHVINNPLACFVIYLLFNVVSINLVKPCKSDFIICLSFPLLLNTLTAHLQQTLLSSVWFLVGVNKVARYGSCSSEYLSQVGSKTKPVALIYCFFCNQIYFQVIIEKEWQRLLWKWRCTYAT